MDFSQTVMLDTQSMPWQASPAIGVERKPLAREDCETGHATSVVRYLAGASFSRHQHPKGEEILVLDGVFSDETGDYRAGHYFRNPPGSAHTPFSRQGCVLFVKLCQFQIDDGEHVSVDTTNLAWQSGHDGLEVMPLHQYRGEQTALVKWPRGERGKLHAHPGGEEIFVLSGAFRDEYNLYRAGCWLRGPNLSKHLSLVEEETVIWVKTGHLF